MSLNSLSTRVEAKAGLAQDKSNRKVGLKHQDISTLLPLLPTKILKVRGLCGGSDTAAVNKPTLPSALSAYPCVFLSPVSVAAGETQTSTAVCAVLLQQAANCSSPSPSLCFHTAFHTLSSCNTAVFLPFPSEAAIPSAWISAALLLSSLQNGVCALSEWKLLRSRDVCPAQQDKHQPLLMTWGLLCLQPLYT